MSKERILLVLPSFRCGGAERVMVHLANHIDRERFEPILAVGTTDGPNAKDVREDVTIYPLNAERSRAAVPAILKAVRTLQPKAVISTLGLNFAVALASPSFPKKTRTLLREGSTASAYIEAIALQSKTRARVYHWSHRLLYGLADKIICQSDFMKEDLAKVYHLPAKKLARIYNPVDFERVDKLSAEGSNPFKGEGPHLLTVGHLYHAKGYDFLLPAFAKVRQKFPGATLTFLGEGEDRK
jgi:glycosyltransferase involved in cell wall biosynthesis